MSARRARHPEPESGKEKPAVSEPVIAGINRSGRKRLGQLADFESSEEPTAGSLENNLPGNQLVGTADPLDIVLPAQTGMSASIGGESEDDQIAGSSNTSQQSQQVQSDLRRNSATSESERSSEDLSDKDISDFLDLARKTSTRSDSEKGKEPEKEVVIVEDSPTVFDGKMLPKTIKSNRFISVVTNTHTLRTQVHKCMKNIDRTIAQIVILEENGEKGSDREEYLEDLYGEIQKENKEIKAKIKENKVRLLQCDNH